MHWISIVDLWQLLIQKSSYFQNGKTTIIDMKSQEDRNEDSIFVHYYSVLKAKYTLS